MADEHSFSSALVPSICFTSPRTLNILHQQWLYYYGVKYKNFERRIGGLTHKLSQFEVKMLTGTKCLDRVTHYFTPIWCSILNTVLCVVRAKEISTIVNAILKRLGSKTGGSFHTLNSKYVFSAIPFSRCLSLGNIPRLVSKYVPSTGPSWSDVIFSLVSSISVFE